MGSSDEKYQNASTGKQVNDPFQSAIEWLKQYERISAELIRLDFKAVDSIKRLAELQQLLESLSNNIQQLIGRYEKSSYPPAVKESFERCYQIQKTLQGKLYIRKLELQQQLISIHKAKQSRGAYADSYYGTGYFIDKKSEKGTR